MQISGSFRAKSPLVRDADCLIESPTTDTDRTPPHPLSADTTGSYTRAVWVGEGVVIVVTEWGYGGLPWLCLMASTVHTTLELEDTF